MNDKDYYNQVYSQDFKTDGIAHGWIQWKGTEPCLDTYCICGHHGHICNEMFFYYYECPECHRKYAVGQNIKLIELNQEQIDRRIKECEGLVILPFKTDNTD